MPVTHAPFLNGDLQSWVGETYPDKFEGYDPKVPWSYGQGTPRVPGEWRLIEEFPATMIYETYEVGRSAVRLTWKDTKGNRYPSFVKDIHTLLSGEGGAKFETIDGKLAVSGWWKIVKRGANYGVQFVRA